MIFLFLFHLNIVSHKHSLKSHWETFIIQKMRKKERKYTFVFSYFIYQLSKLFLVRLHFNILHSLFSKVFNFTLVKLVTCYILQALFMYVWSSGWYYLHTEVWKKETDGVINFPAAISDENCDKSFHTGTYLTIHTLVTTYSAQEN